MRVRPERQQMLSQFDVADGSVVVGEPIECPSAAAAIGRAEALSRKEGHVGAVAFSRTGGPATGDFSDAKVIKKFGDVPDDLLANPVRRLTLATCFHPLVAKIQRLVDGTFRSRSDIGWLPRAIDCCGRRRFEYGQLSAVYSPSLFPLDV